MAENSKKAIWTVIGSVFLILGIVLSALIAMARSNGRLEEKKLDKEIFYEAQKEQTDLLGRIDERTKGTSQDVREIRKVLEK